MVILIIEELDIRVWGFRKVVNLGGNFLNGDVI